MAIKGDYVDRRQAVVTEHAVRRYGERIDASDPCPTVAILHAWKCAREIKRGAWWRNHATSYWFYEPQRLVLVVKNLSGRLKIATCLTLDMARSLGNQSIAKAAKALADELD